MTSDESRRELGSYGSHQHWLAVAGVITVLCGAAAPSAMAQKPGEPLPIPVRYHEHLFIVAPVTAEGQELNLLADTGGGLYLSSRLVYELKLAVERIPGDDGKMIDGVSLPAFREGAGIPPVQVRGQLIPVVEYRKLPEWARGFDGLLGQAWFKGRVWTLDYPGRRMLLRARNDVPQADPRHRIELGFLKNELKIRVTDYPRVTLSVEGETIHMMLHTGATVHLTDVALTAVGDGGHPERAGSFIAESIFNRWRFKHPQWRLVEHADTTAGGAPMIEVPQIEIAGQRAGPVWFTRRPDVDFHEQLSQWMDRRVDGALGGNALHFFRVTLDYPNAAAYLERSDAAPP